MAHPQIRNRGTLGGNLGPAGPGSEMPAGVLAPAVGYIVARADGPAGQPALRSTMRRAGAFATSLRDAAALR